MHADDDSKTTLSKWPFILGDVLLVATSLAIALSVNWQLRDWQVAYCVVAVALGALLFVLPHIVEYRVRVIEEQQDRGADLRILNRDLDGALSALEAVDSRLRALETVVADPRAPEPVADPAVDLVQERLQECELRIANLESATNEMKEVLEAQPVVESSAEPVVSPQVEEVQSTGSPGVEEEAPVVAEEERPMTPAREKPKREKAPAVQRLKLEPRARHKPIEPRLLQRAIKDKQDGAAIAVTRIIESRARLEKEKEASADEPEPASEEFGEAKEVLAAISIAPSASESEPEPADKVERPEAAEVEVLVESNESLEVEPAVEEAKVSDPSAVPASEKEVVKEAPEFGGMLFEEAPSPVVPKREKRAKKKDAVVTASVFIGIGNKPYLRGSGAGLNWEKGFPMDSEEIGKWSWLAPADLDESIEVQVYRNDEDPDLTGEYTLEPGQKLDLWPVF